MPKYKVTDVDTVKFEYLVEAENEEEAIRLAHEGFVAPFNDEGGSSNTTVELVNKKGTMNEAPPVDLVVGRHTMALGSEIV